MPNRIIREGIIDSKAFNQLSDTGQIFYYRLVALVDDYGRYEADAELLRTKLFSRILDRWPEDRVAEALRECGTKLNSKSEPLIQTYRVGEKFYLEIGNFGQRQRAKSKWPGPSEINPQQSAAGCSNPPQVAADGGEPPQPADIRGVVLQGGSAPNTHTHTNTHSESSSSEANEEANLVGMFKAWISAYPKPVRTEAARDAWKSLIRGKEITKQNICEVIDGTNRWIQSEEWAKEAGKYIPDPGTFLTGNEKHRGRLWKDKPKPAAEFAERKISSAGVDPNAEHIQPWRKAGRENRG